MDLTTQLYFLWTLALANGQLLPGGGPPGHRNPGPPDILDPLHLNPRRGPFDHYPPGPGFGHHNRDHGMLEDFLDPLFGDSNEKKLERDNKKDNIGVTTDNAPLKVNLLPQAHTNNTVHEKDIDKKLEEKENIIPIGNNNIQPAKNVLPRMLAKDAQILRPSENKNELPPTLPAKEENILRTNENKTVTPKLINNQISKSNDSENMPVKLNIIQPHAHSGDSIVFPDNVDEMKSKLKDVNVTCNPVTNSNNLNANDKVNMTKNRDGVFFPVQALPFNPMQDTNGKFLLVPISPSGKQPLPITNDVFPNRSPVYTTVRPGQGPIYTSVSNAVPLNVQPSGTWNNGNNNNFQNPGTVSSQNPSYNSAVNYPNANNMNPNLGITNYNPSNNIVNNSPINPVGVQALPNSVEIPTTTFNPNLQQPTTNGYNSQPIYNNQQENQYPTRNLQNNGLNQQTVPSGVLPTYNNIQGSGPQGIGNQNNVLNYNGNNGQTYLPMNVGPNNNVQTNPNGQQFYIMPNNQINNNMNTGQPILLNTQGNTINSSPNGNNNQQYILVNANQLNIPQNGQGGNIYTLQNGQLVALIPVQLSNGALVNNNNAANQMTPVNGNVVQANTLLPNPMNSQPNLVTMNANTNQPNVVLMNGNTPNGAVLLNGQTPNLNGQNSLPNIPVILNGQTNNLNGQNSLPNSPIIFNGQISSLNGQNSSPNGPIILNGQTSNLNGQNSLPNGPIMLNGATVIGNGQTPLLNNGQNLYTMVTVPNNYVNNVGGNSYQVPSSSVNLVNTRDKDDKEDSSVAGNKAA